MHPRMKKAVNRLVFEDPFIGSLLPRLEIIETDVPSMQTNGRYIKYGREFIDTLTDSQCMAVVAHEVFHCIMLHMFRKFGRDHARWNVACDYAINPLVDQMTSCNLPPPDHEWAPLMDTARWPAGTPAEKIYEQLTDDDVPQTIIIDVVIFNGNGTGTNPQAEAERVSGESDWKGAVAVAAQNAKKAGKLSGELESLLERYLNPKLPWQMLLQAWATRVRERVTNWRKRNRHYIPHRITLPGRSKIPTGIYVLAYDVSGSMSDEAVKESLTECGYIINDYNPERVILIEFDAEIKGVPKVFERDEELPTHIQILGRGGTDFRPVFRYIETELDEYPDAVIIFTDGWGPVPEIPPEYPVLWVMVETESDLKMPFGEQIWTDP